MTGLQSRYMGDLPYQSQEEYLKDLFCALDLLLLDRIKTKQLHQNVSQEQKALLQRASHFLHGRLTVCETEMGYKEYMKMIADRREFTLDVGEYLPLEEILVHVPAKDFSRQVLVLALLMQLYPQYRNVVMALDPEGQGCLNLGFCVRLFLFDMQEMTPHIYQVAYEQNLSISYFFPALECADNPICEPLVCDVRLMDILMDIGDFSPKGATVFYSDTACSPLFFCERVYEQVQFLMQDQDMPLVLLWGDEGAGKKHLLKHIACDVQRDLLFYALTKEYQPEEPQAMTKLKQKILYVVRECVLFHQIMVLTDFEALTPQDAQGLVTWLDQVVRQRVPHIFLISQMEEYRDHFSCVFPIELGPLNETQRIELWKYFIQDYVLEEGFLLEPLANTFQITPGQITQAVAHAALMSRGQALTRDLLYRACYAQLDHSLDDKTTRIRPSFTWDDLKLPAEDKEILRDVCSCVQNRHTVLNEWNFKKILPYGGGVTVLFSGPPGTGKTMAAQVIAAELHMELYKIDLSQVIDKYIGETEKNIKAIFQQAKKSNSILFFDEADAIFNKRLEASGANERFANIESSLLLQCIEEYSGITILATNHFTAIDAAFIRRFKYYLLFKEPDEQVRYEIWKSVLPPEAPLSPEVDLWELAHIFEFTGAVIKNIVVSAAYLAARNGNEIGLVELLRSIRREMAKNGLVLTREKMGSLSYLFDDVMKNRLE